MTDDMVQFSGFDYDVNKSSLGEKSMSIRPDSRITDLNNEVIQFIQSVDSSNPVEGSFSIGTGGQVPLRCALRVRPGSDRLTVLFNGAINPDISGGRIVFQRKTWACDIDSHCLYIFDPTMIKYPHLTLSWGLFDKTFDAFQEIVKFVEVVRASLGIIGGQKTLYFGSSGGGYQAIACASRDVNSTAFVINPQIDWTKYDGVRFVKQVAKAIFQCDSVEDIRIKYPEKTALWHYWQATGYFPICHYMVNVASPFDMQDQFRPLLDSLTHLGPQAFNRITIAPYHNYELGHNPPSKADSLSVLNAILRHLGN